MQEKWRDVPSDILEAQGKAFSTMGPAPPKTTNEKKNKNKVRNTQKEKQYQIGLKKKIETKSSPLKLALFFALSLLFCQSFLSSLIKSPKWYISSSF